MKELAGIVDDDERPPLCHFEVPPYLATHLPVVARNRMRCAVCYSEGRDLKTVFRCEHCKISLCVTHDRNCFKTYHSLAYHQGQ